MSREIVIAPEGDIEFGTMVDADGRHFVAMRMAGQIDGKDLILTWENHHFVALADQMAAMSDAIVEHGHLPGG